MIRLVYATLWVCLLGLIAVRIMHSSGIRQFQLLTRLEDRYPWMAAYLGFLSPEKWDRVGSSSDPVVRGMLRLLGTVVLLVVGGVAIYSLVGLAWGANF